MRDGSRTRAERFSQVTALARVGKRVRDALLSLGGAARPRDWTGLAVPQARRVAPTELTSPPRNASLRTGSGRGGRTRNAPQEMTGRKRKGGEIRCRFKLRETPLHAFGATEQNGFASETALAVPYLNVA